MKRIILILLIVLPFLSHSQPPIFYPPTGKANGVSTFPGALNAQGPFIFPRMSAPVNAWGVYSDIYVGQDSIFKMRNPRNGVVSEMIDSSHLVSTVTAVKNYSDSGAAAAVLRANQYSDAQIAVALSSPFGGSVDSTSHPNPSTNAYYIATQAAVSYDSMGFVTVKPNSIAVISYLAASHTWSISQTAIDLTAYTTNAVLFNYKNLFNKNGTINTGANLSSSTGNPTTTANCSYTGYIAVKPNTIYTLSGAVSITNVAANVIVFYDASFTKLSFVTGATKFTHTTPANTAYVRFNISYLAPTPDYSQIQYEEGPAATSYANYGDGIIRAPLLDLTSYPKKNELFYLKNLFNKNGAITTGSNLSISTGAQTVTADCAISEFIPVLPNTQYSISGIKNIPNPAFNNVVFYTSPLSTAIISHIAGVAGLTHTTPANCTYVRFNIRILDTPAKYDQIQYEQSATPSDFIPYGSGQVWSYLIDSSKYATPDQIDTLAKYQVQTKNLNIPNAKTCVDYPMGSWNTTTGALINTDSSFFRNSGLRDVTGMKTIYFRNFLINYPTRYLFYTKDTIPILPANLSITSSGSAVVPATAKFIRVQVYVRGLQEPQDFQNLFFGTLAATDMNMFDEPVPTSGTIVNPNHFVGTQQSRIQQCLDFLAVTGGTVIIGWDSLNSTNSWRLDSSLTIGDNTTLFLMKDTRIKLADSVFDNIIRNKGVILDPANKYAAATDVLPNKNIKIIGQNKFTSMIEGATIPYSAVRPLAPDTVTKVPWVGDNFGWRTITINMANVDGLEVRNFSIQRPKAWVFLLDYFTKNFDVRDLKITSTYDNGDGVDVSQFCSNGKIQNICGYTSDDMVFVGNITRNNRTYPGPDYIYPMYVSQNKLSLLSPDSSTIHDVMVNNITGRSRYNHVDLLTVSGGKLRNINVSNIYQTSPETISGQPVIIFTGYNLPLAVAGEMYNIQVNNIFSIGSAMGVRIDIPLRDSWINDVRNIKAGGVNTSFITYPQDASVKVTNSP